MWRRPPPGDAYHAARPVSSAGRDSARPLGVCAVGRRSPRPSASLREGGDSPGAALRVGLQGRDPRVTGLGLAAVRDWSRSSATRRRRLGDANPLAGSVDRALIFGISQSGRFINEFLFEGFNADEAQRVVFDGAMIHVSGGGRGQFNHRFAQVTQYGSQDQPICGSFFATLAGNTPSAGTGLWTKVSGPGTVNFSDATSASSTATVSLYGTYVLKWTLTNGSCSTEDDVTIDFNEDPAGPMQELTRLFAEYLTTALTGSAHIYQAGGDHTGSTRLWTQVSGIGTITFTDATLPSTSITADLYGTYVLRWTETNGTCSRYDEVEIWFEPTPVISASNDTICNNTFTNIVPKTPTSPRYGVRYTWTVNDPSGQIIGELPSVGNGNRIGKAINQSLNNNGITANEIIYTIAPHTIFADSSLHCSGNTIDVHVWVEPTVVITAVNDTICNNTATGILPVSGQTTTNGIRYTWTVADNPNVTGESNSTGNGQLLGTAIIQTLLNTSNTAQKVTYR